MMIGKAKEKLLEKNTVSWKARWKMFKWLTDSNRWKHLVLAICIGLLANSWYCAEYAGVGVASALEYKDLLYGNKWDWLDWLCTVAGATIGYAVRYSILHI